MKVISSLGFGALWKNENLLFIWLLECDVICFLRVAKVFIRSSSSISLSVSVSSGSACLRFAEAELVFNDNCGANAEVAVASGNVGDTDVEAEFCLRFLKVLLGIALEAVLGFPVSGSTFLRASKVE